MRLTLLTIGQLGRETGIKVETIRFYERRGLMPPPRRAENNYRLYDRVHLRRLRFIRRARDLGFSLEQIRALLALSDEREQSCVAVDRIAKEHRAEVERQIADLQSLKAELDHMINRCGCGVVADCRVIESLSPVEQAPTPAARNEGQFEARARNVGQAKPTAGDPAKG